MFVTNVLQECLLNRVNPLYRCFGPDPFHDYDFMTGGAFAGNDGAHSKCDNQFRFPCWRGRHVSRPAIANRGRESLASPLQRNTESTSAPWLVAARPKTPSLQPDTIYSYYNKTKLSRREAEMEMSERKDRSA
jgi:hypothetical protein